MSAPKGKGRDPRRPCGGALATSPSGPAGRNVVGQQPAAPMPLGSGALSHGGQGPSTKGAEASFPTQGLHGQSGLWGSPRAWPRYHQASLHSEALPPSPPSFPLSFPGYKFCTQAKALLLAPAPTSSPHPPWGLPPQASYMSHFTIEYAFWRLELTHCLTPAEQTWFSSSSQ